MDRQAFQFDVSTDIENVHNDREKMVFAMIEAGGGHRSPAIAVKEAVESLYGGRFDILVVDFMKQLGCVELDQKHKETWKFFLAHPFLCKSSHLLADLTGPLFRAGLKQYYLLPFYSYVLQFLVHYRPTVIFSTHPFNTYAVDYVRRKFDLKVTLITYLTELFDVSSLWIEKGVDYFIVSSEEAKKKLILRGFPPEKLRLFGYPVRQSFFNVARSRERIAGELGIDLAKKTMLMSFGREGVGNIDRFIDALIKRDLPLNLVVNTGQNEALQDQLREKYAGPAGKLTVSVLGYTDRMNELIHVSDFCFIKPGPSTTMEAVSMRKPILFYKAAQISESPNIKYFTDNGVGFSIGENVNRFVKTVESLVKGNAARDVARRYNSMSVRNGAFDIARFVVKTAFSRADV